MTTNLRHQTFTEAFETANEKFNGIDIVVNAAGIMDGAHWEKEIITNVVSNIIIYLDDTVNHLI